MIIPSDNKVWEKEQTCCNEQEYHVIKIEQNRTAAANYSSDRCYSYVKVNWLLRFLLNKFRKNKILLLEK